MGNLLTVGAAKALQKYERFDRPRSSKKKRVVFNFLILENSRTMIYPAAGGFTP